jgi:hypothetical protein
LLYAYPIPSKEIKRRIYSPAFSDYYYVSTEKNGFTILKNRIPDYGNDEIQIQVLNKKNNQTKKIRLIPFGKIFLHHVKFKK